MPSGCFSCGTLRSSAARGVGDNGIESEADVRIRASSGSMLHAASQGLSISAPQSSTFAMVRAARIGQYVRIDHGGLQTAVPEEQLNSSYVGTGGEVLCCEGML
jgi:hypothetical protein